MVPVNLFPPWEFSMQFLRAQWKWVTAALITGKVRFLLHSSLQGFHLDSRLMKLMHGFIEVVA